MPRVLRDLRTIDLGGSFLGRASALPIAIAPMAAQAMAHPNAEAEMVSAAAAAGIPFCLSTSSSLALEDVAAAAADAERWFQLYIVGGKVYSRLLVERAAAAGYRAIVLTVDLPVLGRRERDHRSGFEVPPMPHIDGAGDDARGQRYGHLDNQRTEGLTWDRSPRCAPGATCRSCSRASSRPTTRASPWRPASTRSSSPTTADASSIASIATADALPAIADAVAGGCEVWVDGGIRRGLDVVTALALGATGVLVGRPLYWALAAGGRAGVERAIALLHRELELALPLLGCASFAEVKRELLVGA